MSSIVLNPIAGSVAQPKATGPLAWLTTWCAAQRVDERTRYVSAAIDHVDLEHRMHAWDAARERRSRLMSVI